MAEETTSAEGNASEGESSTPAPPLEEEAAPKETTKSCPEKQGEKEEDSEKDAAEAAKAVDEEKKKKEEEEALREKYKDWPLKNISEIHDNDVLYGRGGGTNHHPGNKRYRKKVEDRKVDYVNSKRLDKPLVALEIIREWRGQLPPGRFLKLDEVTKLYNDVGDKKAREKTSQALREKAPQIRKQQEEERMMQEHEQLGESEEEKKDSSNKSTRFAEGTNPYDGGRDDGVSRAVLARDHSLGREYLKPDEAIGLDGFSWQDPFQSGTQGDGRTSSQGSYSGMPPAGYYQGGRNGSYGPPPPGAVPYRYPSHGSMGGPPPPPPPPGAYNAHTQSGEERHFHYTTSGRYESWGSNGPPPPMPGFGYPHHSGGWGGDPSRENSLGQNPLPHASVGHPAPPYGATFESRGPSSHWGPPPPGYGPQHYHYSGGPPPPGSYPGPPPGEPPSAGPHRHHGSNTASPTSPRYEVDPAVASTWSGRNPGDIANSWSNSSEEPAERSRETVSTDQRTQSPKSQTRDTCPKPDIVKRATSNQNETIETKPDLKGPSVKRAALNRDHSAAANRLKEQYLPDYKADGEKFDKDMQMLSSDLELSTLDADQRADSIKPMPLTEGARTSTLDQIAMDLMGRPEALSLSTRSSTIDALALDLDDESLVQAESSDGMVLDSGARPSPGRPKALTFTDRLSTTEILDIVKEPIPDDDMALVSGKRIDKRFELDKQVPLRGFESRDQ